MVFTCTITLNHDIGPDHSALNVVWAQDAMSDVSSDVGVHNVFNSTTNISTHTPSSLKVYCCNAQIIGTSGLSDCSSIEILSEKLCYCMC